MYENSKNIIKYNGITISQSDTGCPVYVFSMRDNDFTALICPNRADYMFDKIDQEAEDYGVILVDFGSAMEISEAYIKRYMQRKLESKYKITEVNMSDYVNKMMSIAIKNFFEFN